MKGLEVKRSGEQDHKTGFSLVRERARITIMKIILTLIFMILFLLLVISLISNR